MNLGRISGLSLDLQHLPPPAVLAPQEKRRLYARREHGGGEVLILDNGFLHNHTVHPSGRQLMRALYGHDHSGMTPDRYFRTGKHAPKFETPENPFFEDLQRQVNDRFKEISARKKPRVSVRKKPRVFPTVNAADIDGFLDLLRQSHQTPQPTPPAETGVDLRPTPIGIDLANRANEVRRLLFAGFGKKMAAKGYDPEDVLQEVYKGLLTRDMGKSRFDPSRSSFGHYVHLVCQSVLANYHRKKSRQRSIEQVGMIGMDSDSGDLRHMDAATAADNLTANRCLLAGQTYAADDAAADSRANDSLRRHLEDQQVGDLALNSLPLVRQGYSRSEIASQLQEKPSRVGRSLSKLRKATAIWQWR